MKDFDLTTCLITGGLITFFILLVLVPQLLLEWLVSQWK